MGRPALYPEGLEQLSVTVPTPIKAALRIVATRQRQSVSQLVTVILEDYLRRRGELPLVAAGDSKEVPA